MRRLVFLLLLVPTLGCFNSLLLTPVNVSGPLTETLVTDSKSWRSRGKIALIDVSGMILNAKGSSLLGSGENTVSTFRERLDAAAADPAVKAVVLRINSPGGGVTASDIMYHDLLRFRERTNKPVVACMMDVAASGGFYIAMAADKVIAHPTTVTGSIGVIMNLYNTSGLMAKVGVTSDALKSGPNKDVGSPTRPMTESERALLQGIVNAFYDQFVAVVAKGRTMPEEQVRVLADGRIYTGRQAKEHHLVDDIGYLDDAIDLAKRLACLQDARIIAYDPCEGYRGSIHAAIGQIPNEIAVKLDLPGLPSGSRAAFLYLWESNPQ